ncbi:MAG: Gfo/Idh/MocA family oxidoreductase [Erysipelotrichales bacterium]|nr:Gfo/Idh/MocA family oxidoreductase [Erysipelotrichales bacterium]
MKKIKIAVLCPSEIAFRRFMPALQKIGEIEYVGIAIANEMEWFGNIDPTRNLEILKQEKEKAEKFQETFGGKIFESYNDLLTSSDVDAVYIPLPPALHFKWAKFALEQNKHVFVEKPSTTSLKDLETLVELAKEKGLALHENYMFNFHSQIDKIEELINNNEIGDVRLYRIAFGFPFRGSNDFRYNKKMGGGALLDCGGYTLKLATRLLKNNVRLVAHQLNYRDDFEVDIYGSGTLINDFGQVAQISFGMDNSYKCELEVWGAHGTIYTNRIFTAPCDYIPTITIIKNNEKIDISLDKDDSFKKSIQHFIRCLQDDTIRKENYQNLLEQEKLLSEFMEDK